MPRGPSLLRLLTSSSEETDEKMVPRGGKDTLKVENNEPDM